MMTFKEFKKLVLSYFEKYTLLPKRHLKRIIEFRTILKRTAIGNSYSAVFLFAGRILTLNYLKRNWELTIKTEKGTEVCNFGDTIADCCDYLWTLKIDQIETKLIKAPLHFLLRKDTKNDATTNN